MFLKKKTQPLFKSGKIRVSVQGAMGRGERERETNGLKKNKHSRLCSERKRRIYPNECRTRQRVFVKRGWPNSSVFEKENKTKLPFSL